MSVQEIFERLTDCLVIASIVAMLGAVYISWLATCLTSQSVTAGASFWFSLPAWVQIFAGFAITLVGLYLGYQLWLPLPLMVPSGFAVFLRLVGFIVVCGGAALWFWSRLALGAMMGLSTSSATQLQKQHRLIQKGPYAHIRHPMYMSYWLLLAGLTILYRTWTPLLLLVMMIAALYRRAHREEQALAAVFEAAWQTYAARVPMFLPRRPPYLLQ